MGTAAEQLRKDERRDSFVKKPPGNYPVNELNVNPRQGRTFTDATLAFMDKKDTERKIQQRGVIPASADEVESDLIPTTDAGKAVLAKMGQATIPFATEPAHETGGNTAQLALDASYPSARFRHADNEVAPTDRTVSIDERNGGRGEIIVRGGGNINMGNGSPQSGTREQQARQFAARQYRPPRQQAYDPNAAARAAMGDFNPITDGFSPAVAQMATRNQQLKYNDDIRALSGTLATKAMGETGETSRTGQRLGSAEGISSARDTTDLERSKLIAGEAKARTAATAAGATAKRTAANAKELNEFRKKTDSRWREYSADRKNKGVTRAEWDIMDRDNTSPEVLDYYGLTSDKNADELGQYF